MTDWRTRVELALVPCATATGPLDPFHPDSDGDGYMDGAECAIGTNPNLAASKPTADQCRILAGAPRFRLIRMET